MKQPLLSSVWSVMLDGKSSSCKIKALEGSKPTGAIIFEFIKLYSYGLNNIFAFRYFTLINASQVPNVSIFGKCSALIILNFNW